MAPQPLTANYRLVFLYTVQAKQHKAQMYLDCVSSADPSGFDAVARPGFANVGVSTVIDPFFDKIAPFINSTGGTFDGAILYHRSGTTWVFQTALTTTKVPTGTVTEIAFGYCIAMKDSLNKNLPFYLYEGDFGAPQKIASYASLGTVVKTLVNALTNAGGTAVNVDPYNWRISRGSNFSGRFVSAVTDTNEKLRRLRGIK